MHVATKYGIQITFLIFLIFLSKSVTPNLISNPTPCEQTLTLGQRMGPNIGMRPNIGAVNSP